MSNPATRSAGELFCVCLVAGLLAMPTAFADDSPLESLLVGAARISQNKPYGGLRSGDKSFYAPVVRWNWNNVFVDGLYANEGIIGYTFWRHRGIEVSGLGRINTMGYDAGDSPNLAGMADRDWAFEAGIEASWQPTNFGVRGQLFADITSEHEGQEARAELTWNAADRGWKAEYALGVIWQTEDMVDHYFGVEANEATLFRPAYSASSDFSARGAGTLSYDLLWPITLLFHGEYRWFGDEIDDSPIVSRRGQWTLSAAITYRFGQTSRARPRGYRR